MIPCHPVGFGRKVTLAFSAFHWKIGAVCFRYNPALKLSLTLSFQGRDMLHFEARTLDAAGWIAEGIICGIHFAVCYDAAHKQGPPVNWQHVLRGSNFEITHYWTEEGESN